MNYRLWCFQGRTELIQVDDGSPCNPFYSRNWELLRLSYRGSQQAHYQCKKPKNLATMLKLAEALAAPFGFARVDLYNQDGAITFGELTFTPLAGGLWFEPASWDQELGACWPSENLV